MKSRFSFPFLSDGMKVVNMTSFWIAVQPELWWWWWWRLGDATTLLLVMIKCKVDNDLHSRYIYLWCIFLYQAERRETNSIYLNRKKDIYINFDLRTIKWKKSSRLKLAKITGINFFPFFLSFLAAIFPSFILFYSFSFLSFFL